jgi:ParB-like chromosome segregation protein Spo0J
MITAPKIIVENVPLRDVFVVSERRPVDEGAVLSLMESIRVIGLQTPITVRVDPEIPDPDTGEIMGALALISGRHRLEAFRRLGIDRIPAVIREWDDIDAELWEITENLHRADLTKEQRDIQIRRYAELIGKRDAREAEKRLVGQTVQAVLPDGRRKGPQHQKGIAQKVAAQTGLSAKTIRRALFQPDPAKVEENKARKEHDKIIKADLSDDAAQVLFDKFGSQEMPHLLSLLDGSSLKDVIAGLRRRLHDTPIMDRSAA